MKIRREDPYTLAVLAKLDEMPLEDRKIVQRQLWASSQHNSPAPDAGLPGDWSTTRGTP